MYRFKSIYETLRDSAVLIDYVTWTAAITIIKCKKMYIHYNLVKI